MKKLTINGLSKSEIFIGEKLDNIYNYLPKNNVIIITDDNVSGCFSEGSISVIVIPTSEKIKTLSTVEFIIDKLINLNADRNFFLLAIGGGIVCDIAGFVASIYMRGIKFGYVPTTLLSQVDASIGGNMDISNDASIGGNMDISNDASIGGNMLITLPQNEIKSGMAEVVKHAIIADARMFCVIKNNIKQILSLDENRISELIYNSTVIIKFFKTGLGAGYSWASILNIQFLILYEKQTSCFVVLDLLLFL